MVLHLTFHKMLVIEYLRPKRFGKNWQETISRENNVSPGDLDPAVHVAHLNPCYKKFTLIISTYKINKRRKSLEDADTRRIKRSKTQSTATELFPDVCYFCKKKRKKGKGKITYCHKLTLTQVAEKIREVTELKEDFEVLKDVKGVDLLAKEYTIHVNVNISEIAP